MLLDGTNENLVLHHNIATSDKATVKVSSEIGRCKTGTYSSEGASSWLFKETKKSQYDLVTSLSIDDVVATCALARVIFMKLDVDGAEIKVLQSARKSLEEGKILELVVEVNTPNQWAEVGTSETEGTEFLRWLIELFPYTYRSEVWGEWFETNVCGKPVVDVNDLTDGFKVAKNILFRKKALPGCT